MADILFIDVESSYNPGLQRIINGIRRQCRSLDWKLTVITRDEVSPKILPAVLARYRPLGCIIHDFRGDNLYPPSLFHKLPVVYLDTIKKSHRQRSVSVVCDNAAVAQAAFQELSLGLPDCYAAVPSVSMRPWNAERIAVFRALCSAHGKLCKVFPAHRGESGGVRWKRLLAWCDKLPKRCAVFACNDNAAIDVANAMTANHRSIPRNNTIIGADGDDTASKGGDISRISSVRIDKELSGYLAAHALYEEISANSRQQEFAFNGNGSLTRAKASARAITYGTLMVMRRESTRGFGRREPFVLEAIDIIRSEACNGLTARELASRFPVSRNLFERRFREAMGHSVLDEILYVRLQQVLSLLERPEMPIAAISDFCGFDSARELRQLFLRRFNCSMRQWRANHTRQC